MEHDAPILHDGLHNAPANPVREMAVVRDLLKVPVRNTTANYGTAQIGACLIANTRGAVIGSKTTPIEMGRIEEGLGYL